MKLQFVVTFSACQLLPCFRLFSILFSVACEPKHASCDCRSVPSILAFTPETANSFTEIPETAFRADTIPILESKIVWNRILGNLRHIKL